jgi:hypothetical protein
MAGIFVSPRRQAKKALLRALRAGGLRVSGKLLRRVVKYGKRQARSAKRETIE